MTLSFHALRSTIYSFQKGNCFPEKYLNLEKLKKGKKLINIKSHANQSL